MKILGIHASGPNTSACLLIDGELIAFAEEERFTRIKLASNSIPTNSVKYCLEKEKISLEDIDYISLGWDHKKYPSYMKKFYSNKMDHPKKDKYSFAYENISLIEKTPEIFTKKIKIAFRRAGLIGKFPELIFHEHHLSHAYSVFFPSPFKKALILVIDGSGEELATSIWLGQDNEISLIEKYTLPDSLGYFYAAITEFLGFSAYTGEGKVMGLAPYGKPNSFFAEQLRSFVSFKDNTYSINPEFVYFDKRSFSLKHTDKLVELLGKYPRLPENKIEDWHCDLAWEAQDLLERTVQLILKKHVSDTNIKNVCIAGGVAMNCKMNGVIQDLPYIDDCFLIPASNDAGVSYGSALLQEDSSKKIKRRFKYFSPYLGPRYSNEDIENTLKHSKIQSYSKLEEGDLTKYVASKLLDGSIVGWFQGSMEMGARALGNRSIFANPSIEGMKDKINKEVKLREAFRPFAPIILDKKVDELLSIKSLLGAEKIHSYMLLAAKARPLLKKIAPSIVHVDGSVRPQVVLKKNNQVLYELLNQFYLLSEIPVLLNTSFNIRGEPIVCKPIDAIKCFYGTGLDILVLGNFIIEKK